MRDAVSQGLGHCALEKPRNVFPRGAGFGHQLKGDLVHMRHVIPNLQFGFGSSGFGAFDKACGIVKQHFFRANLHKKRGQI